MLQAFQDFLSSKTSVNNNGKRILPAVQDVAKHLQDTYKKNDLKTMPFFIQSKSTNLKHYEMCLKIATKMFNDYNTLQEAIPKKPRVESSNCKSVTKAKEGKDEEEHSPQFNKNQQVTPVKETLNKSKQAHNGNAPPVDTAGKNKNTNGLLINASVNIRNMKGATHGEVLETESNCHIVSFDLDTNLFLLGLFVIREDNIEDMIDLKKEIISHEKVLEDGEIICNPVYFGPNANHHRIQHQSYDKNFIKKVYKGQGDFSITENNKIHVVLYHIKTISSFKDKIPSDSWELDSFYSVDYKTVKYRPESDIISHNKKIGTAFVGTDQKSLSERLQEVLDIFSKFHYTEIRSVNHLFQFASKLGIEIPSPYRKQSFHLCYAFLAKEVQGRYEIGIAIPEGLHRLNITLRAAYNDFLTNEYHVNQENQVHHKLVLKKTPLSDSCSVQVKIPLKTLPSIESLRDQSSTIRMGQNLGHNKSLVDQISACHDFFVNTLKKYHNKKQIKSEPEAWYVHSSNNINDPVKKDIKKLTKKLSKQEKIEAQATYELEQDKILKDRYEKYLTSYNEPQDVYIFTSSMLLPHAYTKIKEYFLFDRRFRLNAEDISTISDKDMKFEIFKYIQLGLYGKNLVMRTEFEKSSGAASLKIHFNIRVVLQFLRLMMMFSNSRYYVKIYASKSTSNIIWTQVEEKEAFFPTQIYEYEMLEQMVKVSVNMGMLFKNYIDKIVTNKNSVKRQKLQNIFVQASLMQILSSVLCIGPNPDVDTELLKEKMGEKEFGKVFDIDTKNRPEFLMIMLDLYLKHVEHSVQTQDVITPKFFAEFVEYLKDHDELTSRKGIDSFGKPVSRKSFSIRDFKLSCETLNCGTGYRFPQGTIVPGTFLNFCVLLHLIMMKPREFMPTLIFCPIHILNLNLKYLS